MIALLAGAGLLLLLLATSLTRQPVSQTSQATSTPELSMSTPTADTQKTTRADDPIPPAEQSLPGDDNKDGTVDAWDAAVRREKDR